MLVICLLVGYADVDIATAYAAYEYDYVENSERVGDYNSLD